MKNECTSKLKIHGQQSYVKGYLNHESNYLCGRVAHMHSNPCLLVCLEVTQRRSGGWKSRNHLPQIPVTFSRNNKVIRVAFLPLSTAHNSQALRGEEM